jgi:hypothetical protein
LSPLTSLDLETMKTSFSIALMRLQIDKFDENNTRHQKLFKKHFGKIKIEDIKYSTIPYFAVDNLSNKMALEQDEIDVELYTRFLKGPKVFNSSDRFYEYLYNNKETNKHYFVVYMKKLGFFDTAYKAKIKVSVNY